MSFSIGNGTYETSPTGEEGTWTPYTSGTEITLEKADDKIYFRAGSDEGNETCMESAFEIRNGKIAAYGNIQSLLDKKMERLDVPGDCYSYMFYGCTSLTQAPALPATTLADYCYQNMFEGCTSLTKAPELPATTLAGSCYYNMFWNCTSLTQAPELPATTLADYCYQYMFCDCTNLNDINVNFSVWEPSNATEDWLYGVAAEGTFTCPTALPDTPRDTSHIPSGWTRADKQ